MSTPKFRCRVNGTIAEAIRFIKDDPTTHWHVNFGHPKIAELKDKCYVFTDKGPETPNDGDWVVRTNTRLTIMTDAEFRSAYDPT